MRAILVATPSPRTTRIAKIVLSRVERQAYDRLILGEVIFEPEWLTPEQLDRLAELIAAQEPGPTGWPWAVWTSIEGDPPNPAVLSKLQSVITAALTPIAPPDLRVGLGIVESPRLSCQLVDGTPVICFGKSMIGLDISSLRRYDARQIGVLLDAFGVTP